MRHDAVTSDGPGEARGSSHEEGVMAFDQSFPGHSTKKNETNEKNDIARRKCMTSPRDRAASRADVDRLENLVR